MTYKCVVSEIINRTPTVKSIRTNKPEGFSFKAGQFIRVISDRDAKFLSISCAPLRNYLEFTKRITTSTFSTWLTGLKPGDQIIIEGPYGNFVLNDTDKKIVFIAGGIGITPIFSILENASLTDDKRDFALFYGNKSIDDIPFYNELDGIASKINLKNFFFIEEDVKIKSKNQFCCGLVSFKQIQSNLPDITERSVFLCGPPIMVDAISKQLRENSIKNVKIEKIIGYRGG